MIGLYTVQIVAAERSLAFFFESRYSWSMGAMVRDGNWMLRLLLRLSGCAGEQKQKEQAAPSVKGGGVGAAVKSKLDRWSAV